MVSRNTNVSSIIATKSSQLQIRPPHSSHTGDQQSDQTPLLDQKKKEQTTLESKHTYVIFEGTGGPSYKRRSV